MRCVHLPTKRIMIYDYISTPYMWNKGKLVLPIHTGSQLPKPNIKTQNPWIKNFENPEN